jgi:uroporphyrinogen decarboxylase
MRQAGRYHAHYQALRAKHSFLELCRNPEVACEAALGPMNDFGFDAAILFSDLLFPLEAMGMGLSYPVSGPVLEWHLRSREDLARLRPGDAGEAVKSLAFQGDALALLRSRLPADKGLLGFVGGPLTLFFYAVEGSHQGALSLAREGVRAGLFDSFCEKLLPLLAENMALQARGGADTIAVLDTCAGELSPAEYRRHAVPRLRELLERYTLLCPDVPVTYYSKGTTPEHWAALEGLPIAALGIDWRQDLPAALRDFGDRYAIQGNIDPSWMLLPRAELEPKLDESFARVAALPRSARRGWICGLGHGVLPKTPEENVRLFVQKVLRTEW